MRLADPRPAADACTIIVEGRPIPARARESVAAALTAAGVTAFRRMPDGSPRGLHCGMGACFDCIVTIDGRPAQRACMTAVAAGMRIGPGPAADLPEPLPERLLTPEVLVVGGGPAGLSAAIAAAECGAEVTLLEERAELGGQYYKHAAVADHRHRRGAQLRARAAAVNVIHAMAWGAFPGPEIACTTGSERLILRPRQLVLATGAHEAPVHLPGWTLPGCITTGALQGLVRTHRVSPGRLVVVAGSGPLNLQVAVELLRAGGRVEAVVEAAPPPSGAAAVSLARSSPARAWDGLNLRAALRRAGVPVLWSTRPVAVLGEERVTGLAVEGPRGRSVLPADAIALNWGFQAETGLARALGADHRVVDGRLETVTGPDGQTSLPGVFAVGDGARMGGAAVALHRGRAAGLAAARALGWASAAPPRAALRRAERFQRALWTVFAAPRPDPAELPDATVLCRCEAVSFGEVRQAMGAGAGSLAMVKRATRAGMGRCAGRFCGAALARLCGADAEAGFAAPRLPLRPVLAGAILATRAEPEDSAVPWPVPTRWTTALPAALPGEAAVVVIGGGIIGLATALFLAREGIDVVLMDRGEPGMMASTANAGSLHVQLVPYVYQENGGGPMGDALSLGPASIALWREIARDSNEDLGLRTEGGLVLAETAAEMALLRSKSAFERSRGIASDVVGPAELRTIAPGLDRDRGFVGAAFCPQEGQGDPLRGTMALLALARRAGVRIAAGLEATGLEQDGAGWRVDTPSGAIRAGQVVNAAGVQAGRIGRLAGVSIPVRGLVQQVIATEAARPMLRQLVAWTGRHLSLKQTEAGHLLIGGGWPGWQDASGAAQVRRESIEGNLALASQALPGLRSVHVLRAWTGLGPHLDRGPLISGTPGRPGLWHGVTGNGYTLGPVVGRMLADAVLGRAALPAGFAL